MLKKRNIKASTELRSRIRGAGKEKKFLLCKECDKIGVDVGLDITAVTCGYCVQRQIAPPPQIKPVEPKEKFPRGWALRATYIHTDGKIFEKGKDTGRVYVPTNPKSTVEVIPLSLKKTQKQQKNKKAKTKKVSRRK